MTSLCPFSHPFYVCLVNLKQLVAPFQPKFLYNAMMAFLMSAETSLDTNPLTGSPLLIRDDLVLPGPGFLRWSIPQIYPALAFFEFLQQSVCNGYRFHPMNSYIRNIALFIFIKVNTIDFITLLFFNMLETNHPTSFFPRRL